MRKVLPILLAIVIAMPALADVTVTVDEGATNDEIAEVSLVISGGAVVRGLAITVTVTGGDIDAIGDVTDIPAGFNAYIDYYYSNTGFIGGPSLPDEGSLPGTGAHALANPDAAGVLDLTTAKSVFSISLGALDNLGNQGGVTTGGLLCKINLGPDRIPGASAEVCVAVDALRGGIVGDTLGVVTVNDCATIAAYVPPFCFNNNLGNYAEWVQFGSPNCWCYERNCKGDADGIKQGSALAGYTYVFTNDLTILSAGYGIKEPTKGAGILSIPNGICADFARDQQGSALAGYSRVFTNDLNILAANYGIKEPTKGPGVPLCPLAGAGGEINFYKYPTP